MKKIFTITMRDIVSSLRDSMIIYIIIFPFILAVILRMMTSSVGATTVNIAVDNSIDSTMVEYLEDFGNVETFDSIERVNKRVNDTDDVFGLTKKGLTYSIIQEGNERASSVDLLEYMVSSYENQNLDLPIEVEVSDIGWNLSPIKQYGGNLLIVFISVFGGMIILINLVEEKQENTLSAVNVSSITRTQYVIGKGLLGFMVPIIHSIGILAILNYGQINYLMVIVVILCIAMISVLIGFLIGVTNDNILGAISSMKMLFIPILGSIFGAIFLGSQWHYLLYWSPFYWAFNALNSIILKEATWSGVLLNCSIIILITGIIFALLSKKIKRGLN
ncbi:ABC transporter permease [Alkalibaculum sporogenes]|nr:ABC transporter permease [Alkalibaculum sporogenes]